MEEHKDESFMKVYNKHCRTKEYLTFLRSPEASVYYFLRSAIIRGSEEVKLYTHPAYVTYKTYFLNGSLVSRYSIKNIAEYNSTSESSVRDNLALLEEDGFIEILQVYNKVGTKLNYYKLGNWTGEYEGSSYKEYYCLDDYFDKLYNAQRKKKDTTKKYSSYRELMNTCGSFDHFLSLVGDDISEKDKTQLGKIWDEIEF